MTDHTHSWTPTPGQVARYSCQCGATGFRASTGEIRAHKTKPPRYEPWTARGIAGVGGQVHKKPGSP